MEHIKLTPLWGRGEKGAVNWVWDFFFMFSNVNCTNTSHILPNTQLFTQMFKAGLGQ